MVQGVDEGRRHESLGVVQVGWHRTTNAFLMYIQRIIKDKGQSLLPPTAYIESKSTC